LSQTHAEMVALNADVVGYSRLIADDLEGVTATIDEYRDLVARTVVADGGTLVNFVGDNFMAVFAGAMDAMRAAIAITTEIEAANAGRAGARVIRFRMGLDQGVIAVSTGDHFGDALNIAARIQALAQPGGISVSGRVYRALDEPALRFRPIGRRQLKGIPGDVDIYEFADLPSEGSALSGSRPLALESPTVAVLPFHADLADDTLRTTANLLRTDMVHRLTRIPGLQVIDARTEPGAGAAPPSARYLIETGIVKLGDQVRVHATVMDVTTMNVVKSHKWTASVADLFGLSDAIADEVGRSVEVDLIVGEPAGLYADLDDPVAIEQVYLGWYHLNTGMPEGWARALELFGEVARTHPDKPYGHVLSAFANWMGASNGWAADPAATFDLARQLAGIGLACGDPTGMARTVEAAILVSEGRPEEALAAIEAVEIVRPTCDITFGLEGSVRRYLGEFDKAVDLTDKAMRLTGVNKPWYPTVKACSLLMGGRAEQAAAVAEMVLEHQPHNLEALLVLAAAQVELGLDRRARATAALIRERHPSVDVATWLDESPYQARGPVERWKGDLRSVGAIAIEGSPPTTG
jgi:adenylate cyclase